jgi:hypothetical protein
MQLLYVDHRVTDIGRNKFTSWRTYDEKTGELSSKYGLKFYIGQLIDRLHELQLGFVTCRRPHIGLYLRSALQLPLRVYWQ